MTTPTTPEARAINLLADAVRHLASIIACANCKGAGRVSSTYQGYPPRESERCPVCKGRGS